MNVVFQLLQAKKRESQRLEQQGKVKYEYDSDEDTEGGTWEHKRFVLQLYFYFMFRDQLWCSLSSPLTLVTPYGNGDVLAL